MLQLGCYLTKNYPDLHIITFLMFLILCLLLSFRIVMKKLINLYTEKTEQHHLYIRLLLLHHQPKTNSKEPCGSEKIKLWKANQYYWLRFFWFTTQEPKLSQTTSFCWMKLKNNSHKNIFR